MSLLWRGIIMKLSTIYKKVKPSPTKSKISPDFAQSPAVLIGGRTARRFPKIRFIEGTSLPASLRRAADGGMTIEAAVVLPLFLFFLLHLGCAVELIRLHGRIQLSLWEICSEAAVYGCMREDAKAASLFNGAYISSQLVRLTGEEYLDQAPVMGGAAGVSVWDNNLLSSGDEMDVWAYYTASPWGKYAAFASFTMTNRFFGHIWTGYEIPDDPAAAQEQLDIVYMTENGSVYHKDRKCTHLVLSIRQVTPDVAKSAKNNSGSGYTPCEKCRPDPTDTPLYITEEGDRYHSSKDCPGLKRNVFSVLKSRVRDVKACSRCG